MKILASRIDRLLPTLIDEEQASFVQGRSISTHFALTQELIRDLNRKSTRGNVVFKVDTAKAYDKLEWWFLLSAMKAFGFSPVAWDLIYRLLCNIWYSLCINGETVGSFRSSRGVRQGDPLSPMLFVLAQHILSFNLKQKICDWLISSYKVGRDEFQVSHLFYADDILLFTDVSNRSLSNLMSLLNI